MLTLAFLALAAGQDLVAKTEPLAPADERKAFVLPEGFEAQLVAAEPDIQKPMNLAFDRKGRLWVTSSVEYPWPAKGKARDKVVVLEDFGPDGRARKITTFADDLNIPIGLLPLADGALVYAISQILHLRDTDGDGKADKREVVLGTYGSQDTHGMTSGFRRGLDGWIYATHGFANTSEIKARDGSAIKLNSGNTYRFRADGSRVEQFSWGQVNPFGACFDARGDFYTADCHSKPVTLILRGGYYSSFGKPHDGLGFAPEICPHGHGSTGIAGVVVYEASHFPEEYRGGLFLGNPVTNRINRDRLEWKGSSPRAVDLGDFFVSRDPWCRPVDLCLGPDGALYFADFYNRIIGHYEVPLTHPGRDRDRGRVWRIVYKGAPKAPRAPAGATTQELIEDLGHADLAVRTAATHELADRNGDESVGRLKAALASDSAPRRAHAMRALEMLGSLDDASLARAVADADALVRVHAMRLLAERPAAPQALAALKDADAFVRRAAADAVGRHPSGEHVRPLLDALATAPAEDVQLRHTIRIALRNQLRAPDGWTGPPPPAAADAGALAEAALAVESPSAAGYLLAWLARDGIDPGRRAMCLKHVARFGTAEALAELSKRLRERPEDATVDLLRAYHEGLQARGVEITPGVREWAAGIVERALADAGPSWGTVPADAENVWSIVTSRVSEDGVKGAPLLSSFEKGEAKTGTLRSPDFAFPGKLSFWIAGHNGQPGQPDHGKNRVVLRLAGTGQEIARAGPPRNDTAKKTSWNLPDRAGAKVYLEATDGDAGSAYAWMAFGRFEPAVVPLPEGMGGDRRQAAVELAGAMKVEAVAPALGKILADAGGPVALRSAAASSLASLRKREALVEALKSAPARLERAIALGLSGWKEGAEALLEAAAAGKASPRLLQDAAIADRVKGSGAADAAGRIEKLTSSLPGADERLQKLLEARRAGFGKAKPDAERGRAVFEKTCAACHKVGDKGGKFAPALDGVGLRGAERLLEDMLDPSRAVDPAFRATRVQTQAGEVISGLLLREEGEVLVLLREDGKEARIPKSQVERRAISALSPMPSNLGEVLPEGELYDLLSWLLLQRAAAAPEK